MKFNELANYLDISLIKGFKKSVVNIVEYIRKRKNLRIKPIDSSFKTKRIAYCFELPFIIISFSSYVNIEGINIIYSDKEMDKLLANNSINLLYYSAKIHKTNIILFKSKAQ